MKKYTLRPAYEGVLVGGSVVSGPNGESIDVVEALNEGGGSIVTDSVILQGTLDNYFGHDGLVFDSAVVDPETGDETPVERPEPATPLRPDGAPPSPSPEGVAAGNQPAEHGDVGDYGTFTAEELRSTLQERNIEVEGRQTKDQMISLLQQDDERRLQEGASDGS